MSKEKNKNRVGFLEKMGFGVFSATNNMASQFMSTFVLFFLTNAMGIVPALAGTLMMIGSIWDAVNDPLLGWYADNHRFRSGEKIRPFAICYAVPYAVTFILLFSAIPMPDWMKPIYFVLAYMLMDTFSTLVRIPYYSMVMLATDKHDERVGINTFVSGGSMIGVLLASVLCWPLVNAFSGVNEAGNLIDPRRGFFLGALTFGLLIAVGPIVHYFTTRERVQAPVEEEKTSLLQAFRMLARQKNWLRNTGFFLLYNLGNMLVTTVLTYYATYVLKNAGAVTIILVGYIGGSLVSLPFIGPVVKKIGRKRSLILASCIYILSKAVFVINPTSMAFILFNAVVMGIGGSFAIVNYTTNMADIVDIVEYKEKRRVEGMTASLGNFISKCGTSLSSFAIGLTLQFAKYDEALAVQPDSAVKAIIALCGWVPMVVAVLMLLVASRITIDEEVAELNKVREAE